MAAARPRCLTFYMTYYTNGSNPLALAMKIIPTKLDVGEKVIYLKSLDNYTQKDKRKRSNALLQELEYIVYQNKENFSFSTTGCLCSTIPKRHQKSADA